MSKKQKKMLIRIIISFVLLAASVFIPDSNKYIRLVAALIPFIIIGWDILYKSFRNILHGQIFDENFLMTIASIGAFVLGDYTEGTAVMLFYQVGELFQSYAVGNSRKSIAALMDIRPDYANIEKDGEIVSVDPDEVEIGTTIIVKPGERIPIDGIIEEGNSYVFVTKGSGHGVGMSQYGAQGMAKEGYDYQAILKHYYQGVVISKNKE